MFGVLKKNKFVFGSHNMMSIFVDLTFCQLLFW